MAGGMIFINYRHDDSRADSGRLYDRLTARYPNRVFRDVRSLEPGVEWQQAIDRVLSASDACVVVIGKNWLNIAEAGGGRRLDDPTDIVRQEILVALHRRVPVFPVLVGGASMPAEEELPAALRSLARRNALEITEQDWDAGFERLVHALDRITTIERTPAEERRPRMKISIDPMISSRIRTAWHRLPPIEQGRLGRAMLQAHHQALTLTRTAKAPLTPAAPHHLALARSALTNDSDGVVSALEAGVVVDVGPDGTIWGTGRYQQLDPGWAEAFALFLESLHTGKHPFVEAPATIAIPDDVQIGLAGDWGTGDWRTAANPAPSTSVRNHLAFLSPEITIHLGSVYYAGSSDREQHLLTALWPSGQIGSLALNSNYEMYSGGKPYFQAVANPPFSTQRGCSFFALENSHWVIVGLDSAYFAYAGESYVDGALFPDNGTSGQNSFLLKQAADAQANRKKFILLTHHNGLDAAGSSTNALWDQVMRAFPIGSGPNYWYWGHVHAGVVYHSRGPNVQCRCCGHGALPTGKATQFADSPNVAWHENRSASDPDIPQRVLNGFAMLYLDGPNINEVFYDENGGTAWQSAD
jgi:hypothetical protein